MVDAGKAGLGAATATALAPVAATGIAGAAGALAPSTATAMVDTGLVDEAGVPIAKEVIQEVPSMASKFAHDVAGHLIKHGMTYTKAAFYATAVEEALRRSIKSIFGSH